MEDYSPEFRYIEGPKNTVADTLSRLDRGETPVIVGKNAPSTENIPTTMDKFLPLANGKGNPLEHSDEYNLGYYMGHSSMQDDPDMVECFAALEESYLNLPFENLEENPLNIENIKAEQDSCPELKKELERYPERYITKQLGSHHVT